MKLYEYQAKELLRRYGVPVPSGFLISGTSDFSSKSTELQWNPVVLKAQVLAGGRGKSGGVRLAESFSEAEKMASDMLGMELKTVQTAGESLQVSSLLIEEGIHFAKEYYLAITLDRSKGKNVLLLSSKGGVEIESSDSVASISLEPASGVTPSVIRKAGAVLELDDKEKLTQLEDILQRLVDFYVELDCSLLEVNPLVWSPGRGWVLLDCKMEFDDSALFRHKELAALSPKQDEADPEVIASSFGLNYVHLDGTVGCMVNGAGLAMATMDLIHNYGGSPANFLDVGGKASKETVKEGFKILMSHPHVKGILVNIFGGIVRCDRVASGVVNAISETGCKLPVVLRLQGTNMDEARTIVEESNTHVVFCDTFGEAAYRIVQLLNGEEQS